MLNKFHKIMQDFPSTIFPRRKNSAGFTLLETLIAVFIITIGIIGIFSLITQGLSTTRENSLKLTATYLAQEGIELVRNLRDNNTLDIYKNGGIYSMWDDILTEPVINCSAVLPNDGCQIDYDDSGLSDYGDEFLQLDPAGFYNYGTGDNSLFKRKIILEREYVGSNYDKIKVLVEVAWQTKGKKYKISVQENLYNWLHLPSDT